MINGSHLHAGPVEPLPMLLGNTKSLVNDPHGGDSAQTNDDFGADQGRLGAEITNTGVLLCVQGVPIAGRAAFDDVGDVDLGAGQVNQGQHQIQQFSGGAYEGLPLQIFLLTGTFSNE